MRFAIQIFTISGKSFYEEYEIEEELYLAISKPEIKVWKSPEEFFLIPRNMIEYIKVEILEED
jgi:hypothetical protein